MAETNWNEIKEKVYYEDGSLRDIYIKNTTLEDWKKWVDLVNERFELVWYANHG